MNTSYIIRTSAANTNAHSSVRYLTDVEHDIMTLMHHYFTAEAA